MSEGRILFIDAHDSFTNNIVALLKSELSVFVEVIKIDDARFVLNDEAFHKYLNGFDAVVAGPGPGHPEQSTEVGLIGKLWNLPDDLLTPVLGICLAFQSMALAFGGTVERLLEPRHGLVTPVLHCGSDIFEDTGDILATQYHSLHVTAGHDIERTTVKDLWRPSKPSKELVPLAWDLSDEVNGPVLMSAKHCHKPFCGIQYHLESICTNDAGRKLIANWWRYVCAWRASRGRCRFAMRNCSPSIAKRRTCIPPKPARTSFENVVQWKSLRLPSDIDIADIINVLREDCGQHQPMVLESGLRNGNPVNAETGSTSIIGVPDAESLHIRYSVSNGELAISTPNTILANWKSTISEVFVFLESFLGQHKAVGGSNEAPFWGGLVGFVSYEAGLETIAVQPTRAREDNPDLWFVFVERSIILDHGTGMVYLQSIREHDVDWLSTAEQNLLQSMKHGRKNPTSVDKYAVAGKAVYSPEEDAYCNKVRTCQGHLRAGSAYELCLTDTTLVRNETDTWRLYLQLRHINPAPFGAYFRVAANDPNASSRSQELSLLSSSPERFLSWSRDGKCQFRPIKGTVKKGYGMTRDRAERILNSPKERAENLMIVDLIRHDLHGARGAYNVQVSKLMSVEEYESVYQLVSVIEGDVEGSGIPVLAASLPPGSMTGAPKKRSCELLQEVEDGKPRGLYSGVFGYLDVGGGGDFSVVIRSAFKWNNEEWRIGAGGAVTALSEPEAEWQEMLAKRENVLRAFS